MIDAGSPEEEGKRIAVLVDREGLGDALLKIPFLRAVRRAFPAHQIWWIATHQTAMEDDLAPWVAPMIDRVIANAGLANSNRDIVERLRRLPPFDLVFDSRTRFATVLLARRVLKHRGYYTCTPGFLLSSRRPPGRWTRPRGVAARMLAMAEAAIGGAADWKGTFDVSAAAQALAQERLPPGQRYVGLAPGSREVRKNWPLDRFMALAQALTASGYVPVFLIGPQEREWLAALRAAVPQALFPEAEPVDPALGIGRLEFAIALGRRLAATVANDSGVGHLMAAIGTPLVSLFGPSDARRWAPFGERVVIVRAQDFGGDTMEAIPADAVSQAVSTLLENAGR
jgi:ADP-heptose:LPS heptosyltransferase